MHVADVAGIGGEAEQQRRRDVVGQVADHAQVVSQRRKIEFEHVAFMDDQAFRRIQSVQPGDEVAVDFDNLQAVQTSEQRIGQCTEPGTDFNQVVAPPWHDHRDDAGNDAVVDQKVLAKPLARNVSGRGTHGHAARLLRMASSAASSMAAIRLSGLALPVPASSSAVP